MHDTHTKPTFVQTQARVILHEAVSSRYYLLRLHCPEIAREALPGQFILLAVRPDLPGSFGCDPLLPRPLAVLSTDPKAGDLELLYFVAGRGTSELFQFCSITSGRESLRILGPFGKGFVPVENVESHLAVGGGSGVAPLVFFFRKMSEKTERHLILAARSKDQLARENVVSGSGITLHSATDDGSAGFKGNAVQAMQQLLDKELKNKKVAIYAAGPEPMMEAAAKVARERGLPCRVSLENRMACGVGVCRGCVVDGLGPHPKTGLKRRVVCQDGPVFDPCELAGAWSA
jgi:dihydroorotate dehydrogenase electron transfer subunit